MGDSQGGEPRFSPLSASIASAERSIETEKRFTKGSAVQQAILDGAQQIALPALVSSLCICSVFLPMFFLTGVAHFLFTPLAMAVIFAVSNLPIFSLGL